MTDTWPLSKSAYLKYMAACQATWNAGRWQHRRALRPHHGARERRPSARGKTTRGGRYAARQVCTNAGAPTR